MRLLDKIGFPESAPDVRLIIYFDEAHQLCSIDISNDEDCKNLHDVISSCFNRFIAFRIFGIYLSTNSHLANLAPSGPMSHSARARAAARDLQAPITEIPFDCHPDLHIVPNKLKLGDITRIEFMSKFGRPM